MFSKPKAPKVPSEKEALEKRKKEEGTMMIKNREAMLAKKGKMSTLTQSFLGFETPALGTGF